MTDKEIFTTWAPANARWVDWVRPLPFITIGHSPQVNSVANFTIPTILYLGKLPEQTAVIVDLPSYDGVEEGVALAKFGLRPIPLYNGTSGQENAMSLVDTSAIQRALVWGAPILKTVELPPDAPPAFLLDSNRLHRFKMNPSLFDNSWDIYDQDIPTADYFLKNGIRKIILHSEKIHKDIGTILYKFQKKGIEIHFTNGYSQPKKTIIKKPPREKN